MVKIGDEVMVSDVKFGGRSRAKVIGFDHKWKRPIVKFWRSGKVATVMLDRVYAMPPGYG